MIGMRTRLSLAQFLALQDSSVSTVLLAKYDAHTYIPHKQPLPGLVEAMEALDPRQLQMILTEVVCTNGDLRAPISPKHRFEERWADLVKCLLLDGYVVDQKRLVVTDPSINDAPPVDDELLQALSSCSAPRGPDIIRMINASSDAFRSTPPDYNACLNNIRVAMETLASDIAQSRIPPGAASFEMNKWGSVITHLRLVAFLTHEEERGLAGVYGFISPGSHRPVGISDEQMARLGRSLALNMCWFLLQRQLNLQS
jgi:hypothetical protein